MYSYLSACSVPVGSILHMSFELSQRAMLVMSHTHHVSISCRQEIDEESERHVCSVMSAYKH